MSQSHARSGPKTQSCLLFVLLLMLMLTVSGGVLAQGKRDPNAPYKDAYDVRYGADVVGSWQGVIRGSSISQGDGVMSGQAFFPRRGYENLDRFGIVLHDHRHRRGLEFSEVNIGDLPCGPKGRMTRVVHSTELEGNRNGVGTVFFHNWLADTQREDMSVQRVYGALIKNPAVVQTEWTPDTFTLRFTGTLVALVLPTKNHTFDYERQKDGYMDSLSLDLEFKLQRTPETQDIFDRTLCDQTELEPMRVVQTTPAHGRENVLLQGAHFLFDLDAQLYPGSLDETTVILSTRGPDNGYIFVDAEVTLDAPDRIRLTPKEALLPGTVYEIELVSGEAGVRGRDSEVLPADFKLAFSTIVEPEQVEVDLYQVSRNASMVFGKPTVARVFTDWKEREDIHSAWQVLSYPIRVEIKDEYDTDIFAQQQGRVKRPDLLNKEEIRLGKRTLDVYGWTPTTSRSPKTAIAHVYPDDPYPEDSEPVPTLAERTINYARQQVDRLTFDYYIAEHSEWADKGADPATTHAIHVAAMRDRLFANQIFPVATVVGRFQGHFNVRDTLCEVPGVKAWMVCQEGFNSWNDPRSAAANNDFGLFFELMHEQIAAHSSADILVAYHPPSLQGGGQATSPFEQPESLARPGDEPFWFGEPDPPVMQNLHGDPAGRNMVVMTTLTRDNQFVPAVMHTPLVIHEFGHIFGLPHTPYADSEEHRGQICKKQYKTIAPGIDGMRVSLDGTTGWQKSSKDGNAQSSRPLLNLMFPCLYETRDKYWIDPNQYDWLLENMPDMVRLSRARIAQFESTQFARYSGDSNVNRSSTSNRLMWSDLQRRASRMSSPERVSRWMLISGWNDGESGSLLPAVTVAGPRPSLPVIQDSGRALEVRVLGFEGEILASALVAAGKPDEVGHQRRTESSLATVQPFAQTVLVQGEPARIQLLRGEHLLAQRQIVPDLKSSRFASHATGGTYHAGEALVWQNADQEAGLVHALRYSPDGHQWRTLAVLLPGSSFTPDPASLTPGRSPMFELTVSDGVRTQVTRLPVNLSIPFAPIATWPMLTRHHDEDQMTADSGYARVLMNAPIQMDSLGMVRLQKGESVVEHKVAIDDSGMQLTVRPLDPEPVVYTLVIEPGLKSMNGQLLASALQVEFRGAADGPPPDFTAWHPQRADSAVQESPEHSESSVSRHNPDETTTLATLGSVSDQTPSVPDRVGQGQIVLSLGQPITLDMQVLECERENQTLNLVRIEFQLPGADVLQIIMSREREDLISATASHGPVGQGREEQEWVMRLIGDEFLARGVLGEGGQASAFELKGSCPS